MNKKPRCTKNVQKTSTKKVLIKSKKAQNQFLKTSPIGFRSRRRKDFPLLMESKEKISGNLTTPCADSIYNFAKKKIESQNSTLGGTNTNRCKKSNAIKSINITQSTNIDLGKQLQKVVRTRGRKRKEHGEIADQHICDVIESVVSNGEKPTSIQDEETPGRLESRYVEKCSENFNMKQNVLSSITSDLKLNTQQTIVKCNDAPSPVKRKKLYQSEGDFNTNRQEIQPISNIKQEHHDTGNVAISNDDLNDTNEWVGRKEKNKRATDVHSIRDSTTSNDTCSVTARNGVDQVILSGSSKNKLKKSQVTSPIKATIGNSKNILPIESTSANTNKKPSNNLTKNGSTHMLPPIFGLPTIKIIQTDGQDNRQVGFVPLPNKSPIQSLHKFSPVRSTCSTVSFTKWSIDSDLYWPGLYDFGDDTLLGIASNDDLFQNAKLASENDLIINSSNKDLSLRDKAVFNKSALVSNEDVLELELYDSNYLDKLEGMEVTAKRNGNFEPKLTNSNTINKKELKTFGECQRIFKIPGLPPAKRPPGRSKPSSIVSCSSSSGSSLDSEILPESSVKSTSSFSSFHTNSNIESNCLEEPEDDVISMYAQSIRSNKEVPKRINMHQNLVKEAEQIPKKPSIVSPKHTFIFNDSTTKRSEGLVNSSPQKEYNETQLESPLSQRAIAESNKEVAQWASTGHYSRKKEKFDFSKIPLPFKNLCYYHFTFPKCLKKNCLRPHQMELRSLIEIKRLSLEQLKYAYEYATDRPVLFAGTCCTFIEAFEGHKNFDLITMLDNLSVLNEDDKLKYVDNVVSGLEAQGQVFNDIIEDIMFKEGNKNPDIIDILLNIVCNRPDLTSTWNLLKKLLKYRKTECVDYRLIEQIVKQCFTTRNVDLCKKFITDIVLCHNVELKSLDANLLKNFFLLLHSLMLQKEAEMFKAKFGQHYNFILSENVVAESNNSLNDHQSSNSREFGFWNKEQVQIENKYGGCFSNVEPNFSTDFLNTFGQNSNMSRSNNVSFNGLLGKNSESVLAFTPLPSHTSSPAATHISCYSSVFLPQCLSAKSLSNHSDEFLNRFSKSTSPHSRTVKNHSPMNSLSNLSWQSSDVMNMNGLQHNISGIMEVPEKMLSSDDIKELQDMTIKKASYKDFLVLLNKYKDTHYCRSFLLNTIALFKNNKAENTFLFFKGLFQELHVFAANDNKLAVMMRILCVNIVGALESFGQYENAADILATFYNDLDNLINVDWFSVHKCAYTSIAKYIYFCKIFTRGKHYQLAFNIFTSELKLLYGYRSWKLPNNKCDDLSFRNATLEEFISATLRNDLRIAMNIILHMLREKDCISEINIWKYFNTLINNMVDCEYTYLNELQRMLPYILEGWHQYLKNSVLRGLLKILVRHISSTDMEDLYTKCYLRQIYPKITGSETILNFATNFTSEEIYVIFDIYLNKINQKSINDVTLNIVSTPMESELPKILRNGIGSISQTKKRICLVLAKCFNYTFNVCATDDEDPCMLIKRQELISFLNADSDCKQITYGFQ